MKFPDDGEPNIPAELYEVERWYACRTRARHEKRVESLLRDRGIESYLPQVMRVRQWKDRKKRVGFPLFPGYLFGRFTLRQLHPVLSTPGISTIVRVNGYPTPVPDNDIENVRRFALALEATGIEAEVGPILDAGQRVRVREGPFEGVEGLVVERRGRKRVLVGLDVIGQALEVDISMRLVERI